MEKMKYKNLQITPDISVLNAMKQMDQLECKLLLVMEGVKFIGLISIGDIQRAVIQNKSLDLPVNKILRENFKVASPSDSFDTIKQMIFDDRMEFCPVVDDSNEVIEVYFWKDVFQENKQEPKEKFNLPIVIMAGGFGSRLRPLTNVLPKPLIPIGEKTMLEEIFDRFAVYGCNKFYVSVNYKADLIKYYINSQQLSLKVDYFIENKPMGTAGSLSLLKGKIDQTFFVSNCDILIEQDYSEILQYHKENRNEITVIAALKHYPIAYGTIETSENGKLDHLTEKPELTFKINSGMYILEPHLIDEIPENEFFHITQLIEKVNQRGGNVGVFPVSEKSWKDIGDWDEYIKLVKNS
jgi:dTDP-glucose pyrophosphorylase